MSVLPFLEGFSATFSSLIKIIFSVKNLIKNQSIAFADYLWDNVNVQNLVENILPTKENAAIIIKKTANHKKETISFYKA